MPVLPQPMFFATPERWRAWLAKHHASRDELWVGFHKRDSGRPSITWPESVDEALCFGWIDGIRKSLDHDSYVIRFTPRRQGSNWSAVNMRRVAALKKLGRMKPAGLKAHAGRTRDKTAIYSFEQDRKTAKLSPKYERMFKANKKAWAFFRTMPPWYQRLASWRIISAKKEETRQKHLARLIANCAAGRTVAELRGTQSART